jgi:hypothetical protein
MNDKITILLLISVVLICLPIGAVILRLCVHVTSNKICNATGFSKHNFKLHEKECSYDTECILRNGDYLNVTIHYPFFPILQNKRKKALEKWLEKSETQTKLYVDKIFLTGYNKKPDLTYVINGMYLCMLSIICLAFAFKIWIDLDNGYEY